jgi:hypothetical protein
MKKIFIVLIISFILLFGCTQLTNEDDKLNTTTNQENDLDEDNQQIDSEDNSSNQIEDDIIQEETNNDQNASNQESNLENYDSTINTCDSLCNNNKEAYCLEERTILVNGEELTGTCRSFSRKGRVEGFNRCEGFCEEFGEIA